MLEVSDETFNAEVLDSDIPVLVDFWATWCGPCKAIAPQIEKLAEQYEGVVKFVKAEQAVSRGCFRDYGVRSIPTFILFQGDEVVETVVGGKLPALRAVLNRIREDAELQAAHEADVAAYSDAEDEREAAEASQE